MFEIRRLSFRYNRKRQRDFEYLRDWLKYNRGQIQENTLLRDRKPHVKLTVGDGDRFNDDFPNACRRAVKTEKYKFGSGFFYEDTVIDRYLCTLKEKIKLCA